MKSNIIHKIVAGILIITTIVSTAFIGLIVYIVSLWPLDDEYALSMKGSYWIKQAVCNVGICSVIGIISGIVTYCISLKAISAILKKKDSKLPIYLGIFSALSIVIISIIAGIQFWINKPYM